jgi:cell division protein FtsW (lipid II flippase)
MKSIFQKTALCVLLFFSAASSYAQEKKLDIDINVGKQNNWYQQPWVWVIGGAVFILLLVALLRRKN